MFRVDVDQRHHGAILSTFSKRPETRTVPHNDYGLNGKCVSNVRLVMKIDAEQHAG